MEMKTVEGTDKDRITLYTLTTCIWCKKTKQFFQDLGIGYRYLDVDSLEGDERDAALEIVKKWNPDCSFPSIVIDETTCIVGFDEPKIRKALGK
jgi:glutaredoxin-like protein NrdH